MLGRSDGVLKPSGVRFGSAEIYNVLTKFFGGEVEDAVCVGRRRETDRDETVCLFIVPCEGRELSDDLHSRIQQVWALHAETPPSSLFLSFLPCIWRQKARGTNVGN